MSLSNKFRLFRPALLLIMLFIVVFALKANRTLSLASDDVSDVPRNQLSAAELAQYLGAHPNTKTEEWASCYKAYREYLWRIEYWAKIFRDLLEKKKLNVNDFEKIDFSLSGDAGYGDDPENEFFNPKGKFKATPIPQAVIDEMTTVKNTKLIFNLRGSMGGGVDKVTGYLPIPPADVLVVIMPNVISKCPAEPNLSAWDEHYLKKEKEIYIAPDNRSVVEDTKSMSGMKFTERKQGFYISSLAARTNWQKKGNK